MLVCTLIFKSRLLSSEICRKFTRITYRFFRVLTRLASAFDNDYYFGGWSFKWHNLIVTTYVLQDILEHDLQNQ